MRVISSPHYIKPAEVLQAQLKKVGINLKIEAMERASWLDVYKRQDSLRGVGNPPEGLPFLGVHR